MFHTCRPRCSCPSRHWLRQKSTKILRLLPCSSRLCEIMNACTRSSSQPSDSLFSAEQSVGKMSCGLCSRFLYHGRSQSQNEFLGRLEARRTLPLVCRLVYRRLRSLFQPLKLVEGPKRHTSGHCGATGTGKTEIH